MGRSTSIAISATDNYSAVVLSMRNATQAFNKNVEGTGQKLDALRNTQAGLQTQMKLATDNITEATKELRRAKEGTEDYGKALERLEEAYSDRNNIASNLKLISDEAKQAEKDLRSLSDYSSKLNNQAGGAESSMLSSLASAGAAAMLGSVASDIANTYVSSAFGSEAASYFSNALSSAAMGASIGSLAGPIGTAVGTAVGGIVGIIQGATEVYEAKDDAFKSYYSDLYDTVTSTQSDSLATGSGIAATREGDLRAFTTLLDGDTEAAEGFQEALIELGRGPSLSYDTIAGLSKSMISMGNSTETTTDRINSLREAAAALDLSSSEVSTITSLFDTASASGAFDTRTLRTLSRLGINAYEAIAQTFINERTGENVTEEMIKEIIGELDADDVIDALCLYMGQEFEGAAESAMQSYSGLLSLVGSYQKQLDEAMGEGYNEERKKGMQEQIAFLSGDGGEMMQEAYKQIGQWQAYLDNLAGEYEYDALTAVMTGKVSDIFTDAGKKELESKASEYAQAVEDAANGINVKEAQATMWRLVAEAQAMAINEYNASDGAQLQLQTQLDLADSIKNDAGLNEKYYDAGYQMGIQFSEGLASATSSGIIASLSYVSTAMAGRSRGMVSSEDSGSTTDESTSISNQEKTSSGRSRNYAYGLSYVPYDNFPALLHEGERVQTASEARGDKQTPQVNISGNFYIREEDDVGKLAKEFVAQMQQAYILAG